MTDRARVTTVHNASMMVRITGMVGAAPLLLAFGCATPCVDDGLLQEFCPGQNEASATEASATEASATDVTPTGSNSQTDAQTEPSGSIGGSGGICPILDVLLESQPPTMILLIDQSGSMTAAFDNVDRWQAIKTTLIDPDEGIVKLFEDKIRFGLTLYTGHDEGDMQCPVLTESAPMLNAYAAISGVLDAAEPDDETPTGDALSVVAAALAADPTPGAKIIVLATDGEPDTCAEPNPQTGQEESVAAVAAAFGQSIQTFVISVGDEVSAQHLQDVANAGVGADPGDPDAPFYQALDQQSLTDAFQAIIDRSRSCKLTLTKQIEIDAAPACVVAINGEAVPFDQADGWKINDPGEIELVGGACDSIQDGEVNIDMKCECDALDE